LISFARGEAFILSGRGPDEIEDTEQRVYPTGCGFKIEEIKKHYISIG